MTTKDKNDEYQLVCDQCKTVLAYTGPEGATVWTPSGMSMTSFRHKDLIGIGRDFCEDCMKFRSDLEEKFNLSEFEEIE